MPDDPDAPEDLAADRDLLDHLLAELPRPQRQVVILHELYGFTLQEIAVLEKTSVTRAHARRTAGMKALREAADRLRRAEEQRGVAALPLSLPILFATHRAPDLPADLQETAWRRVSEALGLDDAPDLPPESGRRPRDAAPPDIDPPRHPGRAHLLRLLGLLGGILSGVALGFLLGRADPTRTRAERPAAVVETASLVTTAPTPAAATTTATAPARTTLAAAAPTAGGAPTDGIAPTTDGDALTAPGATTDGLAPTTDAITPTPADATTDGAATTDPGAVPMLDGMPTAPRAARRANDALRMEQALIDRGQAALDAHNVTAALAAYMEHARRFPHSQHAGARERLRADACAQLRRDPARGGGAEITDLCAGAP